jgi:hypothetical protein
MRTNATARTLATGRSGLVGVVVQTLADPLVANILTACERRLAESACGVLLATTGGSPEENLRVTEALLGRGAEALIFAEVGASADLARAIAARRVHWVSLAEHASAAGVRSQHRPPPGRRSGRGICRARAPASPSSRSRKRRRRRGGQTRPPADGRCFGRRA